MSSKLLIVLAAAIGLLATSVNAEPNKKIVRIFKSKCASCHGTDGKAQTEKGKQLKLPDMTSAEFKKISAEEMKKAILEGRKVEKDGIKKEMDSFKDELKPDQVDGLVEYVRSL